jgi:histidyl-tRNA synthetase
LWRTLGLADITLELNTLGDSEARSRFRERLVKYFEQHEAALDADAKRRLHSNPLRILDSKNPQMQALISDAPRMLDDIDDTSRAHFEGVQALLQAAHVPFTLNTRLVRGLDYYNRTVFEWVTSSLGAQGTVCAGGRYDGLIEQIGGKPAPACGFAMGVERLLELMQHAQPVEPRVADVYLVHQGAAAAKFAFGAAEELRNKDLSVVLDCSGASFKSQMKKADGSGARFALIIGEDEIAAQQVTVKPLRGNGEQLRCALAQAVDLIREK